MKNLKYVVGCLVLVLAIAATASAQPTNAFDHAANYTSATWTNNSNGGYGFGLWTLTAHADGGTGAGAYIGGSGENTAGPSFGIYGGTLGTSTAFRAFSSALTTAQTFSIDLGNTTLTAGGATLGLTFFSGATPEFTLQFTGGQNFWQLNDGGSFFNTSQGYVGNTPLLFTFKWNVTNSYSYTFGSSTGLNYYASNPISDLTGVNLYDNAQGNGQNFGFDNIAIIPEPSTLALIGLSLVGGWMLRPRKV